MTRVQEWIGHNVAEKRKDQVELAMFQADESVGKLWKLNSGLQ